jgi:glycosyltransferase involved in cell wall biosynthesis
MVPELFTNDFKGVSGKTLKYKKETIVKANHIITISENTKKDLVSLYKIPKDKISVIYLGNPLENAIPDKVENLPKRYLLFVGNRQGYKNFVFFIKSIAPILNENGTLFLVCTGGGIFSTEEKALFSKLNITNQIKQINFENDNELAYIYKNAIIYILPSLYEGFGMTVLEAFSMGCPVVASNISSIPEVCEKAALYIDPKNTNSIRRGIEKIMNDKEIRKRLVKSGFEQVKKFSWCVTVNKTLKTYKNLIGK